MCASAELLLLALTWGRGALRAGVDGGLTTARNGWWRYGHAPACQVESAVHRRASAALSVINVGLQGLRRSTAPCYHHQKHADTCLDVALSARNNFTISAVPPTDITILNRLRLISNVNNTHVKKLHIQSVFYVTNAKDIASIVKTLCELTVQLITFISFQRI